MKHKEFAKEVTKATHATPAAARDLVDEMAHEILRKLRAGEPVEIPGMWEALGMSGSQPATGKKTRKAGGK